MDDISRFLGDLVSLSSRAKVKEEIMRQIARRWSVDHKRGPCEEFIMSYAFPYTIGIANPPREAEFPAEAVAEFKGLWDRLS